MGGAIAAGHPVTAETGAQVLAAGGNAVDACVAASLASWVAESPLTGPGGGGFMLVHRAGETTLLDFFTSAPGLGREGPAGAMDAVDVDFSGDSIQVFKIGWASVAVPGAARGLEEAHRRFGSLPWKELAEPAVALARAGVVMTPAQGYLHAILDPILRYSAGSRAIYGEEGPLEPGDTVRMPELAGTLELIAERGADVLYRGELAERIAGCCGEGGGSLTLDDLAAYEVVEREPVRAGYRGHEFVSNPPPSTGGALIARGLRVLDGYEGDVEPGSADAVERLVAAFREQARGLADGTTHISVVDRDGNAAALTISTGAGAGVVVPGTGIQLNNMIGEFDVPDPPPPGERMRSMMSPSIVFADGAPRLVVGSAGSLRLRSAVLQVVVNVVGHGLTVEEAIDRPRVHWEDPHLHLEGGTPEAVVDELVERGYEVVRWRARNLYFGGASAVEVRPDGSLHAEGDPRRGGHGIVVE